MFLKIEKFGHSVDTSVPDPDDMWDRASTSTSWEFGRAVLKQDDEYDAEPVDDGIKVGDTVYAVIVIYSSGDTFGHDHASSCEVISIHKDRVLAYKNKEAVDKDENPLMITMDNGETLSRYKQWDGYFESLESCQVEKFTVET